MILHKLMPNLIFFVTLAAAPLAANVDFKQPNTSQHDSIDAVPGNGLQFRRHHSHHHPDRQVDKQAYGKLSASPTIENLVISNPKLSVPSTTGWQPFPVDTFSTFLNTSSPDPTNATIIVKNQGTYLINALLTLAYPTEDGPDNLTNYAIGVIINNELQFDSIGSLHISTEAGGENPGLLFSASLSDLVTVPPNSTIQFVISAGPGAADPRLAPRFMQVISANATVVKIGS